MLARGGDSEEGFRSGYLLGVEDAAALGLADAAELDGRLRDRVVAPLQRETGRRYSLSFLKAARGRVPDAEEGVHYAGFHLDTHPEITAEHGFELARVLINLDTEPRRLRVALTDRYELAAMGVSMDRGDYQVVDLPEGMEEGITEIPGRVDGTVHGLRFWASVVPHVGAGDDHGHFLASYEAVAAYDGAA